MMIDREAINKALGFFANGEGISAGEKFVPMGELTLVFGEHQSCCKGDELCDDPMLFATCWLELTDPANNEELVFDFRVGEAANKTEYYDHFCVVVESQARLKHSNIEAIRLSGKPLKIEYSEHSIRFVVVDQDSAEKLFGKEIAERAMKDDKNMGAVDMTESGINPDTVFGDDKVIH